MAGLVGLLILLSICSLSTTVLIEKVCHRWQVFDLPGERKLHSIPVPRMGGLAFVLIPTLALLALSVRLPAELAVGALIAFAGGLYDDLHPANSVRVKLAFQIPAALVFIYYMPMESLGLSGLTLFTARFVGFGFVLFMTNAANLMDNMNGLTGGLALAILSALVMLASWTAEPLLVPLAILIAAVLGFYLRNFPLGRIYMGDQGSQLLGFTLGAVAVRLVPEALHATGTVGGWLLIGRTFVILAVLFLIFLADVSTVTVTRLRAGAPVWVGDQNHLSHRLARRGLGTVRAVLVLIAAQVILALSALALLRLWRPA